MRPRTTSTRSSGRKRSTRPTPTTESSTSQSWDSRLRELENEVMELRVRIGMLLAMQVEGTLSRLLFGPSSTPAPEVDGCSNLTTALAKRRAKRSKPKHLTLVKKTGPASSR